MVGQEVDIANVFAAKGIVPIQPRKIDDKYNYLVKYDSLEVSVRRLLLIIFINLWRVEFDTKSFSVIIHLLTLCLLSWNMISW